MVSETWIGLTYNGIRDTDWADLQWFQRHGLGRLTMVLESRIGPTYNGIRDMDWADLQWY